MAKKRKPSGYWTKERCWEESKKYNSRSEFNNKATSAYQMALRNKWLDEICSHMEEIIKPSGFWTKKRCQSEADKYITRREFKENSLAYVRAQRNGWLDEICSPMEVIKRVNNFWTKERCSEEAKKCKSRSEFKKEAGGVYQTAKKKLA